MEFRPLPPPHGETECDAEKNHVVERNDEKSLSKIAGVGARRHVESRHRERGGDPDDRDRRTEDNGRQSHPPVQSDVTDSNECRLRYEQRHPTKK